jgi:hypothetical protein
LESFDIEPAMRIPVSPDPERRAQMQFGSDVSSDEVVFFRNAPGLLRRGKDSSCGAIAFRLCCRMNWLLLIGLAAGRCSSLWAQALPAGSLLEARLSSATGSSFSHPGDPIEATVIAPVSVDGRILVPVPSKLYGSVTTVNRLALLR